MPSFPKTRPKHRTRSLWRASQRPNSPARAARSRPEHIALDNDPLVASLFAAGGAVPRSRASAAPSEERRLRSDSVLRDRRRHATWRRRLVPGTARLRQQPFLFTFSFALLWMVRISEPRRYGNRDFRGVVFRTSGRTQNGLRRDRGPGCSRSPKDAPDGAPSVAGAQARHHAVEDRVDLYRRPRARMQVAGAAHAVAAVAAGARQLEVSPALPASSAAGIGLVDR